MSENSDPNCVNSEKPADKARRFSLGSTEAWGVILVLTYFFFVILWCLPGIPQMQWIMPFTRDLMVTTGLRQNWALFGPKTTFTNMHHIAKIRFADGTVKLYEWPRVDNVDLIKKSDYEPYSKLLTDNISNDFSRHMRVSLARFIARANANPANPPRLVTLIDVASKIPDAFLFYKTLVLPPHTEIRTIYVYQVQPKDLK